MKIHFIGIGGIGISALAKYYLSKGHQISGSDLYSSEIIQGLEEMGAKIHIGLHRAKNCLNNVDLVIYSPAVPAENPELKKAKKLKIKCLSYPQALGNLTKEYFTIAVCGTHGKSTTAAMVGLMLIKAGLDPTIIVGTKIKELDQPRGGSNCRIGKSKYLVIEADEHFSSFLNYWPKIIVLTTLEPDHLDYYKNFKNYLLAFKNFIQHLPKNGILIANEDDINIVNLISELSNHFFKIKTYSLKQEETNKIKSILKVPGEFNISNALATLTVGRVLKIQDEIIFKSLSEFKGTWRRFESVKILKPKPYILINDYGHHPTQIKLTLKSAREKYPKKEIWCIFQPHQYQRTYYLFNEFIESISSTIKNNYVNKFIITDIYDVPGRENSSIKKKVNSKKLAKQVNSQFKGYKNKKVIYIPSLNNFKNIIEYIKTNIKGGEVIIIMGAGNIYQVFHNLALDSSSKNKV